MQGNGKISDFKCWTNDKETTFADFPIEKEWANNTELENAYVRTINFPSKQITKTKITYKSIMEAKPRLIQLQNIFTEQVPAGKIQLAK